MNTQDAKPQRGINPCKTNATTRKQGLRPALPTQIAMGTLAACLLVQSVQAANTENDYKSTASGTGNVTTAANWSQGRVPIVSDDAVFNASSKTGIKDYGSGVTVGSPITVGSLDVTATTGSYSIRNDTTSATNAVLTLGGTGNLGNGISGTSGDLLYAATGGSLSLLGTNSFGAGILQVALGQSGNFDAVGTINVTSVISDGGTASTSYGVTKTGGGTLTLGGANTFSGGVTLSAGTLSLTNGGTSSTNSALGTGTFTINGGSITNVTSSPVTIATNNAQTWAGDFTFVGTSSPTTSNLNLGTGAVTLTGTRVIIATGTTSTLTVGGAIGDNGSGYGLTKGSGGAGNLILAGANTYGGATTINAGTLTAAAGGGALGGTSGVFINSTGTLAMGASGQFNAATPAPVTFNGASAGSAFFKVGASNQGSTTASGIGALTLMTGSVNNVLDFSGRAGVVSFAGLTANSATLTIIDYIFNGGAAGGSDQLIFQGDQTANLGNIVFTGYGATAEQLVSGTAGGNNAFYEVFPMASPIPEPTTVLGGALLVGVAGWGQRRRLHHTARV